MNKILNTVLSCKGKDYIILMSNIPTDGNKLQRICYKKDFGFFIGVGSETLLNNVYSEYVQQDSFVQDNNFWVYHVELGKFEKQAWEKQDLEELDILLNTMLLIISNSKIGIYTENYLKDNVIHKNYHSIHKKDYVASDGNAYIQFSDNCSQSKIEQLKEKLEEMNMHENDIKTHLLEMLQIFNLSFEDHIPFVQRTCSIGIVRPSKEPFYLEGKIDELESKIQTTPFDKIENQLTECEEELTSWEKCTSNSENINL